MRESSSLDRRVMVWIFGVAILLTVVVELSHGEGP